MAIFQKSLKPSFLLIVTLCAFACVRPGADQPSVGVPDRPDTGSSIDSLRQGLMYIRQNPTEREDERIQRFLWLDQWVRLLDQKGRMTPSLAQEFQQDLSNFVQNPPLSRRSLERIATRAETQIGKNVTFYQLYITGLRTTTVQDAMEALKFIEEDGVTDLYARAQQLLELQVTGEMMASRKIGVLIPLTGELASFGEAVFNAVQLVSDLDYSEGVEFVVHDIGDTEAQLLEAFQRLVLDEGVSVLMGPVTNRATEYIFERAQIMRVPTISLAPRENLEFYGNYNFRSTLTLYDQVRAVASFLRRDMRVRRVGILFPDSGFGWDAVKLAEEEFKRAGLDVTEIAIYDEGATDFKHPLQKMARLDFPRLRSDELCSAEEPKAECVNSLDDLPPLLNFEALFVPDFADTVGLLMPTLPFLRIYGLQVVGLASLHDRALIERGQQHADGLIFPESFLPDSQDAKTRFFVNAYQDKNGAVPSRLAAEAFDLALLLTDLMVASGSPADRDLISQEIRRLRGFDGVTGLLNTVGQEIRRDPKFLVVRDGNFTELQ